MGQHQPSRRSAGAIERASAADRAFLAMDGGAAVPEQLGVVLVLDAAADLDVERVRTLIGERIRAVPRLRQRLVDVPFGCGGPIWVDDAGFDIRSHVWAVRCPVPGDQAALLSTALAGVTARLRRDAPLWSVVLVSGLPDGRAALVVTLHHALADGLGGLAVLGALADPGHDPAGADFPRRRPPNRRLVTDAWRARAGALRRVRQTWRTLRATTSAGGGVRPPRAAPCSLIHPSGPGRRMAVVTVDIGDLASAAHRRHATTNDAVLVATAGALCTVLASRGQAVDPIVITVPVSGREPGGDDALGNLVSPLLVPVPTHGGVEERLRRVAAYVQDQKSAAYGPPPIATLGWLFRPVARVGGFRWYMSHQRRMHTLVANVRGPRERIAFDGRPVAAAIPISVGENGNTTVQLTVLSYAGTLTISAIVDPDHFPELDLLTRSLRSELQRVMTAS